MGRKRISGLRVLVGIPGKTAIESQGTPPDGYIYVRVLTCVRVHTYIRVYTYVRVHTYVQTSVRCADRGSATGSAPQ